MGKCRGRDAGAPMLGPNFRLPRNIKKSKRPSGSTAIHKKRQIWLQGFSCDAQGQRKNSALKKQSLARSELTCQKWRGRRHLVPERETQTLGSEFTRAEPGPNTSPPAWRRRTCVSWVMSLGDNSLPVGARRWEDLERAHAQLWGRAWRSVEGRG